MRAGAGGDYTDSDLCAGDTEVIGHVIMEIESDEICAAVAYYHTNGSSRVRHKAIVTEVRQRSNGNFVIEFDGWRPAERETSE